MTRLAWGAAGERLFELGVDRGVLYVGDNPGVPWNGLVSVSENPSGGEAKAYYVDGVKYLNRAAPQEFSATIEAYTYPDEFAECDGTVSISNGLFSTQHQRKPFGLAYRSLIGNEVEGLDHGYKIHLIYDALSTPSSQTHGSMSDSVSPFNFSWTITTKPPILDERKPTSHFVINTRYTPPRVLRAIEDILYGTDSQDPRLPSVHELFFIFNSYNNSGFDAGEPTEPFYTTFDAMTVGVAQTSTIDGGAP